MSLKAISKRLDPSARSELILEQALRLFAERHYSVVTVRDIALACEIQNGLIYYYFENKDHLLRATLAHAITQIRATYPAPPETSSDPRKDLMTWLRRQAAMSTLVKSLTKVMADYSASANRDSVTDKLIKDLYNGEQLLLEQFLRRAVEKNLIQKIDVAKVARMISLQIDGIFFSATSRDDDRIAQDIEDLCGAIGLMVESQARL